MGLEFATHYNAIQLGATSDIGLVFRVKECRFQLSRHPLHRLGAVVLSEEKARRPGSEEEYKKE